MLTVKKSREGLRQLFNTLDKDGNGEIDSTEWGKAVSKHASDLASALGGNPKNGSLKGLGKLFSKIDADGSGTITWNESQKFGMQHKLVIFIIYLKLVYETVFAVVEALT